jgi:hypothetical protein
LPGDPGTYTEVLTMAEAAPPASPPQPLTLDLTRWTEPVAAAFASSPAIVATSNGSDPDLAMKGSLMVWDADHLAFWERSLNETLAGLRANPKVAVLVRPQGAPPVRFYGEARLVDDANEREAIWQKTIPQEQSRDPEKKGYAVLIRVDRIRQGPQSVTR